MSTDMTETADKTPADTPETTRGGRVYQPISDIVETPESVTLMLEMPGVAADDVDITLEQRVLTICGSVQQTQPEKLQLVYAEYGEGDFERAFTLSDDFDSDKIEASLSHGVLTVTLPRAPEAKPKKISVKTS